MALTLKSKFDHRLIALKTFYILIKKKNIKIYIKKKCLRIQTFGTSFIMHVW